MDFTELTALVWSLWLNGGKWYSNYQKADVATTLEKLRRSEAKRQCAKYNLIEVLTCERKRTDADAAAVEALLEAVTGFAGALNKIIAGDHPLKKATT